jgi:uncharacterized damage-inducible protein DinB
MATEEFRSLFQFNAWANRRALEACAALSPEDFVRDLRASFPSVRDTFVHVLAAEWIWHERWHGRSPSGPPPDLASLAFADLRARLEAFDRELFSFVSSLAPADLDRVVDYRNMAGKPFSDRLGQTLRHLVNHGSYHRGQIAALLRQLGAKPLGTDLITFYREQGKGAAA